MLRYCHALAIALLLMGAAVHRAAAQNITTVEGPAAGEQTTLSQRPHAVTEDISIRAIGVDGRDSTRWVLSVIGTDREADVQLESAGAPLPILRVERPPEGPGKVMVFLTKETFYTLAQTEVATMTVGGTSFSLTEAVRRDMQAIYERVL